MHGYYLLYMYLTEICTLKHDIQTLCLVFELQYNSGVLRRPETCKRRLFSSERHPINKRCGQLFSLIMQQNLRTLPPRVCDCAATWKCSGFLAFWH